MDLVHVFSSPMKIHTTAALSLPSPRPFFAFLFTEQTTSSPPFLRKNGGLLVVYLLNDFSPLSRSLEQANSDEKHTFPGAKHSLIWPIRVCAAEQGMVFRVLTLKQGILILLLSVLNTVSFQTRSTGCEFWPCQMGSWPCAVYVYNEDF